jgi:hypothetical protein
MSTVPPLQSLLDNPRYGELSPDLKVEALRAWEKDEIERRNTSGDWDLDSRANFEVETRRARQAALGIEPQSPEEILRGVIEDENDPEAAQVWDALDEVQAAEREQREINRRRVLPWNREDDDAAKLEAIDGRIVAAKSGVAENEIEQARLGAEALQGKRDAAVVRGKIVLNPELYYDRERYVAAVNASSATPREKARALAGFYRGREETAKAALPKLRGVGAFRSFADTYAAGNPEATNGDVVEAFRKSGAGDMDKWYESISSGFLSAMEGVGYLGFAGAELQKRVGQGISAVGLDSVGNAIQGAATRNQTDILAGLAETNAAKDFSADRVQTLGGASTAQQYGQVGGQLFGQVALTMLSGPMSSLVKGAATAATKKALAAEVGKKLGVGGLAKKWGKETIQTMFSPAGVMAGASSAGPALYESYERNRTKLAAEGLTGPELEEAARGEAFVDATRSALITSTITSLFGLRGVEGVGRLTQVAANPAAREVIKKTVKDRWVDVGLGALSEGAEEALDEGINGGLDALLENPDMSFEDWQKATLFAGSAGALFGGGIEGVTQIAEAVAERVKKSPEMLQRQQKAQELRASGLNKTADALEQANVVAESDAVAAAIDEVEARAVGAVERLDAIDTELVDLAKTPGTETRMAELEAERDSLIQALMIGRDAMRNYDPVKTANIAVADVVAEGVEPEEARRRVTEIMNTRYTGKPVTPQILAAQALAAPAATPTPQANRSDRPAPAIPLSEQWDRDNRSSRSDEWFEGANANTDALEGLRDAATEAPVSAHGLAKEATLTGGLRNLLNLIAEGGVDQSRGRGGLDTAPLAKTSGSSGAGAGTASGSAYLDGPFVVLATDPGVGLITDSRQIGAVLVNEANIDQLPEITAAINAIRPDIIVAPYSKAGDAVREMRNPNRLGNNFSPVPVSPVTPVKAEPTFRAIAGRPAIVDNETGDIRIDEDGTVLLDRGPAVPPIIVSRDPDAVLSTSEFNVTLDEETEADVEQARVLRTTIGGRPTPRPIERPKPSSTFVRDDGSIVTSFSGERGPVAAVTDFVSEGETEAGDLFVTVKDRETGSEFELHGDDALTVAVARRDTARDTELTEAVTAAIPAPTLDFDRVLVRMIGPKANLLAVVDRIGTERIVSQQRLDAALDELTSLNTEIENENFPEDIRTRLLGVVDDAFNDIATVRARVRQRPEAPADRGTPAPATPLTGGTEETVDRAPAESPASNQITESSLDSPPESVETGAMPQVDSPGMTRRQEALDAGLDRRTADGLGAAVDLGNMMRELAARTPEQVRQDHVRIIEEDMDRFPKGAPLHGSAFEVFIPAGGQQVDVRRKGGKIEVVAGDPSWTPAGEPKPKQAFKKGVVIETFDSTRALVDRIRGPVPDATPAETPALDTETARIALEATGNNPAARAEIVGALTPEQRTELGVDESVNMPDSPGMPQPTNPASEKPLSDESAEMLRDIIAMRKSQGQAIDPNMVARLARYDAAKQGVEIPAGGVVSQIVVGHPLFESPHAELKNLLPLQAFSYAELDRKWAIANRLREETQTFVAQGNRAHGKAKTAAQKKKAEKDFPRSEISRKQEVLDHMASDTFPEFDRMFRLLPAPQNEGLPNDQRGDTGGDPGSDTLAPNIVSGTSATPGVLQGAEAEMPRLGEETGAGRENATGGVGLQPLADDVVDAVTQTPATEAAISSTPEPFAPPTSTVKTLQGALTDAAPLVERLNDLGVRVVVVKNEKEASDLIEGRPVRKSARGFTSVVDGVPTIVIIESRTKGSTRASLGKFLRHEAVHGAHLAMRRSDSTQNDAALAALLDADPALAAKMDSLYPGYAQLSPQGKLSEIVVKIAEGRLKNNDVPQNLREVIQRLIDYLLGEVAPISPEIRALADAVVKELGLTTSPTTAVEQTPLADDVVETAMAATEGNEEARSELMAALTPEQRARFETAEEVPEAFDLSDWVVENYPQEFSASQYLDPSAQYRFHTKVWENAGRPVIDTESTPEAPAPETPAAAVDDFPVDPVPLDASPTGTRPQFNTLTPQQKINLARNIAEFGWSPEEFGATKEEIDTTLRENPRVTFGEKPANRDAPANAAPAFEIVRTKELENLPDDDGYFYHVTTKESAEQIVETQELSSAEGQTMADGFYRQYSAGKVFLSDAGGVGYWMGRIGDHLEAQGRNGRVVVLRVPKRNIQNTQIDELGTTDSRQPAWYAEGSVRPVPLDASPTGTVNNDAAFARHAELEAKNEAGTITPEEIEEARGLVEAAAKQSGYNRRGVRFGYYVNGVPLPPSRSGELNFGPGYYVAEDATLENQTAGSVSVSATPNNLDLTRLGLKPEDVEFRRDEVFVKAERPYESQYGGNYSEETSRFVEAQLAYDSAVQDYNRKFGLPFEQTNRSKTVADLIAQGRIPFDSRRGLTGRAGMSSELVVQNASQIKSAEPFTGVPLSQRFNPESNSILEAAPTIMRAVGLDTQAGANAEMSAQMQDSLVTAQKMHSEGVPSETIRAITGWHVNPYDKMLRWEIPDNNASFVSKERVSEAATKVYGGEVFNSLSLTSAVDRIKRGAVVLLGDVFTHDALFQAYPDAAQIPFFPLGGNVAQGSFRIVDGNAMITATVTTDSDGNISDESVSTMLHELQHFIQHREGFATGGSPDSLVTKADILDAGKFRDAFISLRQYEKNISTLTDTLAEERSKKGFAGFGGPSAKKIAALEEIISQVHESVNQVWAAQKKNLSLDRDSARASLLSALVQVDAELGSTWVLTNRKTGLDKLYRLLAGEIEARDTQARRSMTEQERAVTTPYSSENIAPESAIVIRSASPQLSFTPDSDWQDVTNVLLDRAIAKYPKIPVTKDPNIPAPARTMGLRILVNPEELARYTEGMEVADAAEMIEKIFLHEATHRHAVAEVGDNVVVEYANTMTADERTDVAFAYLHRSAYPSDEAYLKAVTDFAAVDPNLPAGERKVRLYRLGHEALRMSVERLTSGYTTEETLAFLQTNPGNLQRFIRYLGAYLRRLKEWFAARKDPAIGVEVKRLARVLKTLTKGETIPRGAAPFDPLAQRRMVSFQGRPVMIEAPATGLEAPAYHGTPHKWAPETLWRLTDGRTEWIIDGDPVPSGSTMVRKAPAGRVRADKVGSGEGAAAYGWGVLYAAENEGVAKEYQRQLSGGRVRSSGNSPRIL